MVVRPRRGVAGAVAARDAVRCGTAMTSVLAMDGGRWKVDTDDEKNTVRESRSYRAAKTPRMPHAESRKGLGFVAGLLSFGRFGSPAGSELRLQLLYTTRRCAVGTGLSYSVEGCGRDT